MGTLNKQETENLFHREAVLIGSKNVFPMVRAEELFGENAVLFAKMKSGETCETWNFFGVKDFDFEYLNYAGFLLAVSYYNAEQMKAR